MKYVLVSGGVISGVGKGIVTSSLGTILKSYGLRVTAIKIDPYLNIDAGTFSPYEHGETFVILHSLSRLKICVYTLSHSLDGKSFKFLDTYALCMIREGIKRVGISRFGWVGVSGGGQNPQK